MIAAAMGTALRLVLSIALLTPAGASSASTGNTGNSGSGAVVTPLLEIFKFGNAVGLPLACSDAGSIVSIIGSQTGGTAVASKLVTQLDTLCQELSSKGGDYLQQAIAQSRALTLLNPLVNPLISDLAKAANTVGTQEAGSLSPFGPTVAGLGGTVTFFEGS
jgi:hypothetical protein